MTRPQVIADCETTSLTPQYGTGSGVIWELALLERETGRERLWRMKPEPDKADPSALSVGRFYERTAGMCKRCKPSRAHDLSQPLLRGKDPEWSDPAELAAEVALLLHNVTLIAANPTFDANYLTAFLNHYGQAATWHFRLRDIGSIAHGYLAGCGTGAQVPAMDASTDEFALALGIDPDVSERHSALGDCRLVAAMLGVMEGGPS